MGAGGAAVIVRFWEARVAQGRLPDAVEWARAEVLPVALAAGATGAELVQSDADPATGNPPRIVVLTRWSFEPEFVEADPDPEIVERAHAWNFRAG
jgi:hypothetical protein